MFNYVIRLWMSLYLDCLSIPTVSIFCAYDKFICSSRYCASMYLVIAFLFSQVQPSFMHISFCNVFATNFAHFCSAYEDNGICNFAFYGEWNHVYIYSKKKLEVEYFHFSKKLKIKV